MQSQVYTERGNTIRAARSVLGATATLGQDFKLDAVDGGFVWSPMTPEGEAKLAAKLEAAKTRPAPSGDGAMPAKRGNGKKKSKKKAKGKKKAPRSKPAPESLREQPKMAKLIGHIKNAPGEGATVAYLARLMGWQEHTVRGSISHLRSSGVKINVGRKFRMVYYTIKE